MELNSDVVSRRNAERRTNIICRHLSSNDEKVHADLASTKCSSIGRTKIGIKIAGVGRYIPQQIVTNKELEQQCNLKPGWIKEKLGLTERRRASSHETTSWMAAQAGLEAIKDAKLKLQDIDLLINASGTPERAIPDSAPLVQEWMGLNKYQVPAFSVHATCLSFIVALEIAAGFIATGLHKNILIVSSEIVLPCGLNWNEPHSACLFGDLAAAAVIVPTPNGESSCLNAFQMKTWGEEKDLATIRGGGSGNHPASPDTKPEHNVFHMEGNKLLLWALEHVPPFLDEVIPGLSQGAPGIDWIIPHQPSGNGMLFLQQGLGWGDKVINVFEKFGNTISSAIPSALYEAIKSGKLKRGQKVLFAGTGAGLSIAMAHLTY